MSNMTTGIISNGRSFGCPIIYTDTIHNAIFFVDTSTMRDTNTHSLIGTPCLAIIASNAFSRILRLNVPFKADYPERHL